VGVGVGVGTGVGVEVGSGDDVGARVGTGVGVASGVGTGVGVEVEAGAWAGIRVGISVGVRVSVEVGFGVGVGEGVSIGPVVGDRAGERVNVNVGWGILVGVETRTVGVGEGTIIWIGAFEVDWDCKMGLDERVIPDRFAPAIPRARATIIMTASNLIVAFSENSIVKSIPPPTQFLFYLHLKTIRIKGLFPKQEITSLIYSEQKTLEN